MWRVCFYGPGVRVWQSNHIFFFFFLAQNEELTLKEKFVITKVALFNVTEDKIQTYFPCEITNVTLHMEMFKQKRFSIFINFF